MHSDNSFILLGRTGVGKSTLTKILSEDKTIIINNSTNSCTQKTKAYNCEIGSFRFSLIDTPGYDDSKGKDRENYKAIKQYITSSSVQLKGIVLMFNFQDPRFSDCHRKGLQKIVSLIPLDNFWDYVIIIFTRYFSDDPDDLEEEKNKTLKNFEKEFDIIISAFNRAKGTKIVPFSHIKTIFVNLKIKKTKKYQLNDITSKFIENSKLEPLYQNVKIEEKWEKLIVKEKNNDNKKFLYDVKFKVYNYYNKKGDLIKQLSIAKDKKKLKEVNEKDFKDFQEGLGTLGLVGYKLGGCSAVLAVVSIAFPPAFGFFATSFLTCIGAGFAGFGGYFLTEKIENWCNEDFIGKEIVDELFLENDED